MFPTKADLADILGKTDMMLTSLLLFVWIPKSDKRPRDGPGMGRDWAGPAQRFRTRPIQRKNHGPLRMGDALRRMGDAIFAFSSQREINFRRMGDLFAEWATLPNGPRSIQRRQFCCVTVHSAAKFQPNGRCCSRMGDVAAEWAMFGAEWAMFCRMGDAPNGRCAKK